MLLGDATTVENEIPGLSASDAARMEKEYNEEMQPIRDAMSKIYEKAEEDYKTAKAEGVEDAMEKLQPKSKRKLRIYEKK